MPQTEKTPHSVSSKLPHRVPDTLPDSARLWIFAAREGHFEPDVLSKLVTAVEGLIDSWKSHGTPVNAAFEIRYNRFLIIAADVAGDSPSGCSIDSLYRSISAIFGELGLSVADESEVFSREQQRVDNYTRAAFQKKIDSGEVGSETPIFDNSITTLAKYRSGEWELPFDRSWCAKYFS